MEVEMVCFEDCPNWQVAAARRAAGPPRRPHARAPVGCRTAGDPDNAGRLGSHASPEILVTGRLRFAGPCHRVGLAFRLGVSAGGDCHSRTVGLIQAGIADAA
jgi:hypothetical protein